MLSNFSAPAKWLQTQVTLTSALGSVAIPTCSVHSRPILEELPPGKRGHPGADWLFPSQHHNVEEEAGRARGSDHENRQLRNPTPQSNS